LDTKIAINVIIGITLRVAALADVSTLRVHFIIIIIIISKIDGTRKAHTDMVIVLI